MNRNPLLLWLFVFFGVAVQASVETNQARTPPDEISPLNSAQECRVEVSGHARVRLSELTASAVTLVADGHARIDVENIVSTTVDAAGTDFANIELVDYEESE
jgi:hypothetical protein